ncbi:Cdc7p-Dbf4p kinase complex regulatory subunit [Recurvomyces mirabilis]|uniref:Cdc7p-Dbf4p kinase complex regulatory subunit n=1 Tax=Recurvomyces mirabilis TaxID=574656 RepID=A0AAE0TM34_9PEZI|nr:Cdc7p-Dbf4p kinase complex regulatory subunit [Recurvomyces mirabilis]KAK5149534.1 Cdc7p-Dbf4p kinase complex regulatory subunit [Recurvomyces mirabilis]
MASRRAPLANVPNAVNSPFRNVATTNGKRTRAQLGDAVQGQPPAKKQAIELPGGDEENRDPARRAGVSLSAQEKLEEPFMKRSNAVPTAFEKKLAAARERKPTIQQSAQSKERMQKAAAGDNLESVRQWQRHYRRQFPSFVLYFDGVSDDIRQKTVRQIQSLGAREEKFFSKQVTHVITTRSVPSDLASTSPDEDPKYNASQQKTAQPTPSANDQRRTTSILDAHLQRRTQSTTNVTQDIDPRKVQTHGADILTRARQLGIKIWALEKLQRMLNTILETDAGGGLVSHSTRTNTSTSRTSTKTATNADLEQLLRNEKVNGPADRDMTVAAQDMCVFSGFYLYVHDMDEKTKPVMVRDYPKVSAKEEGKWPQFRLSGPGRCPFVEDPAHAKRVQQQNAAKAQDELAFAQRKTRAASAQEAVSARAVPPTRALTERQANLRRSPRKQDNATGMSKPLDPPKGVPGSRQSSNEGMPALFGSAQQSLRGLPRMIGGEPVASGVQPSNVTSAIRSQYISSAAISSTAPGANYRVGDSKEVSALKRKVLERGASVTSNHSMPSSHMNDIRAALNHDTEPPPRAAKRKAQETLGVVPEDDETGTATRPAKQRKATAPAKKKPVERDPKPGYCENCRDKFEDFDEHIVSRKHRKFALTQDNWKELDVLLSQLKRPHKPATPA